MQTSSYKCRRIIFQTSIFETSIFETSMRPQCLIPQYLRPRYLGPRYLRAHDVRRGQLPRARRGCSFSHGPPRSRRVLAWFSCSRPPGCPLAPPVLVPPRVPAPSRPRGRARARCRTRGEPSRARRAARAQTGRMGQGQHSEGRSPKSCAIVSDPSNCETALRSYRVSRVRGRSLMKRVSSVHKRCVFNRHAVYFYCIFSMLVRKQFVSVTNNVTKIHRITLTLDSYS